ncbi:unnamed protein product, partial [Aphanomyces euteiches]
MRLIENVKEDVTELQAKFRAHYNYSEASRMSKLRDIPPIAGAVMWSKQIERKLHMLLSREDGSNIKLDAQLIFDHWVNELVSVPTFDVRNIILNILSKTSPDNEDGLERELSVAFNHQIVTLFKEVRNLEWLGYRVPFTLKMIAEDAKENASFVREVRTTIAKTFTKDNEIRWHSDHLGEYALDLANKVETLSDKVEDLWKKQNDIEQQVENMRQATRDESQFQSALEEIQKVVDELNLAGYSNLHVFVKQLNHTIAEVLTARLERSLNKW